MRKTGRLWTENGEFADRSRYESLQRMLKTLKMNSLDFPVFLRNRAYNSAKALTGLSGFVFKTGSEMKSFSWHKILNNYEKIERHRFYILSFSFLFIICFFYFLKNVHYENFFIKQEKPVISLDAVAEVEFPEAVLDSYDAYPVTYRWKIEDNGDKWPALNLKVKSKFVTRSGEIIAEDDHFPPVSASTWKPGQTIQYSRYVFFPKLSKREKVSVFLGLEDEKKQRAVRLPGLHWKNDLNWAGNVVVKASKTATNVQKGLLYYYGWYPYETGGQETKEYNFRRWMGGEGLVYIKNTHEDSILYIKAWAPRDVYPEPPEIQFVLNGITLEKFKLASETISKKYSIPAEWLGDDFRVLFKIIVDQTFIPKEVGFGKDNRKLGLLLNALVFKKNDNSKNKKIISSAS